MKISKKFPTLKTGLVSGLVTHGVSVWAAAPYGTAVILGLGTFIMASGVSYATYSTAMRRTREFIREEKKGLREKLGPEAFRDMDIASKTHDVYARIPADRVRSLARDRAYGAAFIVTLFGSMAGVLTGMHHREEMKKDLDSVPQTKTEIPVQPPQHKRDSVFKLSPGMR
ncbi:MAG TPA: hypothetical protein VGF14_07410 [Alphaproteobacteria bacterium]